MLGKFSDKQVGFIM